MEEAERPFRVPHESRSLPALPEASPLDAVLRYAFLSHAGIEQAYFEWKMAMERIPQAISAEDPRFSFDRLFSDEGLSRWDRSTLGVSQMVPFPGKLEAAGQVALDAAIAARRRFEDARFSLRARVVGAWYELSLADRSIDIAERNLALLRDFAEVTRARLAVGGASQAEATKADLEAESAESELLSRRSERPPALARLNALLSRAPDTPLRPSGPSDLSPLPGSDSELLALAAERNRDLLAMAAEVRGREDALELARKAYFPDFEISLSIQGTMERMLGGMINAPLRLERIRAGIDEAGAGVRHAQAAARARRDDLRAQVVLQIFVARDTARQADVLRRSLVPRAREVVDANRAAYASGTLSYLELLDAQRSLLALDFALAQAESMHEQAIAELGALCAIDFDSPKPAGGAR